MAWPASLISAIARRTGEAKFTAIHVAPRHLLNIHKQYVAHLLNIYSPLCCHYIRPNSVLFVCCGLLAKWSRVRVRAEAMNCTSYTSFFSLSLSLSSLVLISAVNTIVFVGAVVSVSARREYLTDDVRNTDRGELNLSPQWTHTQRPKPHGYHFETCEMAANSETELLPATLPSYYFPFFQYKRTISLLSLTCKGYDLRPISKPVSY